MKKYWLIIVFFTLCIIGYKWNIAEDDVNENSPENEHFTYINFAYSKPSINEIYCDKEMIVSCTGGETKNICIENVNIDIYDELHKTETNSVYTLDYYTNDSYGYRNLKNDIIVKYIDDNSSMFSKISYINYLKTDVEPNEEWIDFFADEIRKYTTDKIPVIITESWMWECNGVEYAAVNATNVKEYDICVNEKDYDYIELLNIENPVVYKITALFSQNTEPLCIESNFNYISTKQIKDYKHIWFFESDFEAAINSIMYKYDILLSSDNNILSVPVYTVEAADVLFRKYRFSPSYVFADIDGDAIIDVIYDRNGNSSEEEKVMIYKVDNNTFVKLLETD